MAEQTPIKYLDLEGLKTLFGIVETKVTEAVADKATKDELTAVERKVDAIDVEGAIRDLNMGQYAKTTDVEGTYAKKNDVYTKAETDEKVAEVVAGSVDLTPYLKTADAETTYAKIADVYKKSETYAKSETYSQAEVDAAIDAAKEAIVGEDLKESLDTLESIKSWKEEHGTEYTNLLAEVQKKADATTVESTYAKKAEVEETYATKAELGGYQVKGDYALKSELTGLATESFVNGKVAGLASETYVNGKVAGLASEEYVDDEIEKVEAKIPTDYVKTADLPTFTAITTGEITAASVSAKA